MKNSTTNKVKEKNNAPLTSDFWNRFMKIKWEKEEVVDKESLIRLPVSEEELFDILVEMSDLQREGYKKDGELCNLVRMYIGTEEFNSKCFHLYPNKKDKNFRSYSRRVEQELNGKSFAYVVDFMTMPPKLKAWTNDFLLGMYRPLKAISFGHFWSVFYGNYTSTPFGVHDHKGDMMAESAFYFPIVGNKKMKTWKPEYVEKNPEMKDALDVSKYEEASTLLSANPGDMMYWPSDRWHIGSSAGGDVSMVLAVRTVSDGYAVFGEAILDGFMSTFFIKPMKFFRRARVSAYLISHLIALRFSKHRREKQIKAFPFNPDDLQGSAAVIPTEVRTVGEPFAFLFKDNFERALSAFWLIHLSTLGAHLFEERLTPIDADSAFRMKRQLGTILLWRHVGPEQVMMVSDYHVHEMPVCYLPIIKCICSTKDDQELIFKDLILLGEELKLGLCLHKLKKLVSFLIESQSFVELPNEHVEG